MKRCLLNLVTTLFLLLCVAVCVLWVRGQFVADSYATARSETGSVDGSILFLWGRGVEVENDPSQRGYRSQSLQDAMYALAMRFVGSGRMQAWDAAEFGYRHAGSEGSWTRLLIVPCWALAALFALLPLGRAVQVVRTRRRPRPGHFAFPEGRDLHQRCIFVFGNAF